MLKTKKKKPAPDSNPMIIPVEAKATEEITIPVAVQPLVKERKKLDGIQSRRPLMTYSPTIGNHKVHITIGRFDDNGPIVEVSIALHKFGSPFREMMRLCSIQTSRCLVNGVSIDEVISDLEDAQVGGPSGVVTDFDGITEAPSVPNLVSQMLRLLTAQTPASAPVQLLRG